MADPAIDTRLRARPEFTPSINLGQLIQIVTVATGLLVGGLYIRDQADSNSSAIAAAAEDRAALEIRIRALEIAVSRQDEKYGFILTALTRIDTQLERIQGK
tara:strand:+ start:445 stop:750 length:306 start_codon:yes stop_codon:yes gene_type:complete